MTEKVFQIKNSMIIDSMIVLGNFLIIIWVFN